MNGWIEIFKTGTHTARNGKTRTFGEADLDRMAETYNPANHEAPAVIGHPKENAPAWGWVDRVKRRGEKLLATFRQVQPEFENMVASGMFKKRSISVYPDGSLRHVGFLGAMPPAVKGLADIQFADDDDCEIFEFEEENNAQQHPAKEGDMPTVEELQQKLANETAAREAAEADAKKYKTAAEKSEADFSEATRAAKKKEIADFIEAGIEKGKILPSWKDDGLATFMEHLAGVTDADEFEFAEGKGKQTPAKWFEDFLTSFSEHPLFKEMGRPKGDGNPGGDEIDFSESLTDKV